MLAGKLFVLEEDVLGEGTVGVGVEAVRDEELFKFMQSCLCW